MFGAGRARLHTAADHACAPPLTRPTDQINPTQPNRTPPHYAGHSTQAAVIVPLVREMGADAGAVDMRGDTPAHTMLRSLGTRSTNTALATETAKALAEAGIDLSRQNGEGDNALHLAGRNGATAPVIEALVRGAQQQGCLAEALAARNGRGATPFLELAANSRISAAFSRARGGRGQASDLYGDQAAADPIELYLANGAEWEAVNPDTNDNALHVAVAHLDPGLVQALLERDASGQYGPNTRSCGRATSGPCAWPTARSWPPSRVPAAPSSRASRPTSGGRSARGRQQPRR